ncbi:MAG: type II secretion system protein [Alphaproteobacteria bacterium]|nr:type II secretion system protein [Alphaproteobacteria bacterium]MBQ8256081.1 type II secretion system protein [Alphaproteobacteria bacterium]
MKNNRCIFADKNNSRGSMLVELLLSIALAAIIIPFAFKNQQNAAIRAQNIAITNQMSQIQTALERYIVANRPELLKTVGRNITRVDIADLAEFGLADTIVNEGDKKYQLRILKSSDGIGQSTLQGIVVRVSDDITPLRTREIVNLSSGSMGFIDETTAYGTFGTWHADAIDLDLDVDNAIIETTKVNRDETLYLWRVPSQNPDDAKMMSALNLGGHDIKNTTFINAEFTEISEYTTVNKIVSDNVIFQNRTSIDGNYQSVNTMVAGMLSSDAKNIEIAGGLTLGDVAKFSSLTAENMWVSDLTLGGLNIDATDDFAIMKINQSLNMTSGRIEAMFVTVGFTGSITPRLVVNNRIEDSTNPAYYWDAQSNTANFADASFVELNRMAVLATRNEKGNGTESGQIFGAVATNKNATVADYMNAIHEIQKRVSGKYHSLHLE